MTTSRQLADHAVAILNEMLAADQEATQSLVEARFPCNEALADHPTIQVGAADEGDARVGLLGVINGIVGTDDAGLGYVAACYSEDGRITSFLVIERD